MGAKTLLSLAEFEALPDDGNRHELNQGQLVVMPPPKSIHSLVQQRINLSLSEYVGDSRIGVVFSEAGYLLSPEPESTVRQPDVSFLSMDRVRKTPPDQYYEGAPELAVEIVSPSDSAEELKVKIKQYLESGGREVWVFYPKIRSVDVHKKGATITLSDSDTLTSDLFPGWSARVADFFDFDY